jgi:hypothetical protein
MRPILATLVSALMAGVVATTSEAAELLMFEQPGCSYCRRWDTEIGPGYAQSNEGKRAPLRRFDIRDRVPEHIKLKRPVTITPTFVLIQDGQEVGRVAGYGGSEFFYVLLDDLMAKLPAVTVPPTEQPGRVHSATTTKPVP